MSDTASLTLPLLLAEQAQKHVTHNEALKRLDALVRTRVEEQGLTTPPGSPSDGTIYIPGSGATGAWSAWDFNLAYYVDGAWQKIVPKAGWIVYDIDQGAFYIYVGAPLYWTRLFGTAGLREVLSADRTYYVNASAGSDSNDGLSAGAAFATIQKAIDVAAALDGSIYDVTIQLANGTYVSSQLNVKTMVGAGSIFIIGDEVTPSNVIVEINGVVPNHSGFYGDAAQTTYHIRGVKIINTGGSSGWALWANNGSRILYQNVEFGPGWIGHVNAGRFSYVEATGDYTISADTAIHVLSTGSINISAKTITLTGTPNFSFYFAAALENGVMRQISNTFVGSATGKRYESTFGGIIRVLGAGETYFPGDVAGTTDTGGIYA